MHKKNSWNTSFFINSPIIKQLKSFTSLFGNHAHWPTLNDYAAVFIQNNMDVKPVHQSDAVTCFEDQYEPRVFLKGELQTRTDNWHDFFNALIWLKFPISKGALNTIHYQQARLRGIGSNRSTLENRITQFDECGAIIVSNNQKLLDLIENHQWHELFINEKQQFGTNLQCVIFGHAIFEKALDPYIGMTCHCILINDSNLLNEINRDNFESLDDFIANYWKNVSKNISTKLKPLPLLGIPGYWYLQNNEFYNNKKYFR